MKKTLIIMVAMVGLVALATAASYAVPTGEFEFCGYRIIASPSDPEHPGLAGEFTIDTIDPEDEVQVHLTGTYEQASPPPQPTEKVVLDGTIQVGSDPAISVHKEFLFGPKKKMVWKQIVAWIESVVGG